MTTTPKKTASATKAERRARSKQLGTLPTGRSLKTILGKPTSRDKAVEALLRELLGRACEALGVTAEDLRAFKPRAFNLRALALGIYVHVARSVERADMATSGAGKGKRAVGIPWRPLYGAGVPMPEFRKHLHYSALYNHREMLLAHLARVPPNDFSAMLDAVRGRLQVATQAAWDLVERRFPLTPSAAKDDVDDDVAVEVEVERGSRSKRPRPEAKVRVRSGPLKEPHHGEANLKHRKPCKALDMETPSVPPAASLTPSAVAEPEQPSLPFPAAAPPAEPECA